MSITSERLREHFNHDVTDAAADEIETLEESECNAWKTVAKLQHRTSELETQLEKNNPLLDEAADKIDALEKQRDELLSAVEHEQALTASRDAEVAELVAALERMRVAGGSQEFHIAWELAKDVLARARKP